jgi:hypothetical protein
MTRSEELRRTAKGIWPYIVGKIREMLADTTSAITTAMVAGLAEKLDLGATAYCAASVLFGTVDSGSSVTDMTATVPGLTELRDGVMAYISNPGNASKATWTLNVNGLGAKPVYPNHSATRSSTIFAKDYTMLFIYRESRVSGGCWDIIYGYNSDTNTIGYNIRRGNGPLKVSTALYRYQVCFTKDELSVLPANAVNNKATTYTKALTTEAFDPFGPIYYYSTTSAVSSGNNVSSSYMYTQYSACDLRYSFNINPASNPLTADKDVFLVCSPQTSGLVKLYSTPLSQALPTTADGLVYIRLGRSYLGTDDTTCFRIALDNQHPIYQFKDNKIQLWTGA